MLQAARQGGAGVLGSLLTHWQRQLPGSHPVPVRPAHEQSRTTRQRVFDHAGAGAFCRSFYQCAACRQGRFPDDERLDIVNTTYSPGVRRLMARAGSQTQFEQAAQDLRCYAGLKIEPREIERVAEEVGRQVEEWLSEEQEQIVQTGPSVRPRWSRAPSFMSVSTAPECRCARANW